jgi:hypothetical protein
LLFDAIEVNYTFVWQYLEILFPSFGTYCISQGNRTRKKNSKTTTLLDFSLDLYQIEQILSYLTEYLGVGAESMVGELGIIMGTGEEEADTSALKKKFIR